MQQNNRGPARGGQPDGGEQPALVYADKKEVAKGGVLGFFIGLAVIVPGVSGSAVAIIFRLYEKLLYAFGNIFRQFKRCIVFLLPIIAGGIIGLAGGFLAVQQLINLIQFAIVALFAGLMLGAFPAVTDQLKGEKITPARVALFAAGLAVPIAFAALSVALGDEGGNALTDLPWYFYVLFAALGFVISVTQLVPGLSASAILMMFGFYKPLLDSLHFSYIAQSPAVLGVYACLVVGFLVGLVVVSKGMNKLLQRRRAPTFFTVAGMSLGSVITMFYNPEIVAYYGQWGSAFAWWELLLGLALFAGGVAAAYFFVRYERAHSAHSAQVSRLPQGDDGTASQDGGNASA